ncbi:MAG: type II secretion system protein GspD [Sphingomonas sp.]
MLKYADVSEVVGLLTDGVSVKPNNVFIRREPGFGSMSATSGTSYVSPSSQGIAEAQPLGESVDAGMAIDRRLNAIWLRGSRERIDRIKGQIALIDVPVDSVILETQFVELTEQGSRNIGIDFANANGQIASGSITRGNFAPFGADLDKNIYSASVQAAIYAQVQKGNGRIVSTPRIAAQSGDTAKILTGDALPILTSIALSGVNAVSQQVQYVNVGVTLQIAPRVSPDGFVTSHIYAVASAVTGSQQGYPTISQREAETSASVRDGETFVIGGLTLDNALMSRTKVPILGDIPLLGALFRVDKSSKSKTDLYIVITPHIVRHRRFGDFDEPTLPPAADIGTKPQVPAAIPPAPPPARR